MSINILATNLKLTPVIRKYVEKKIESFEKFIKLESDKSKVRIEVGKTKRGQQSGAIFRAEITITYGPKIYRAEATTENIMSAIDQVRDKTMRELRVDKRTALHVGRRKAARVKKMIRGE